MMKWTKVTCMCRVQGVVISGTCMLHRSATVNMQTSNDRIIFEYAHMQ